LVFLGQIRFVLKHDICVSVLLFRRVEFPVRVRVRFRFRVRVRVWVRFRVRVRVRVSMEKIT